MKRILLFLLVVVFGVLGPAYLYLGSRLADTWYEWLFLGLPFLTVLSLPVVHSIGSDRSSGFAEVWAHAVFFSMGMLTYVAVFTIVRDIAWVVLFYAGFEGAMFSAEDMLPARVVIAFASLALAFGVYRAARGPIVKNVLVESDSLPPGLEGFKIVQISDLHIGQTIRRRYVERMVRQINEVAPDLIAMTGDIGDGGVSTYQDEISLLGEMKSLHGVFYVTGNHEYYWNAGEWMGAINSFGGNVLTNRGMTIDVSGAKLFVAGITDPQAPGDAKFPQPDLNAAIRDGWDAGYRVLLSHRPGFARRASELGFDLQLSGHTHGGQFFPWTLVVRMVHEFALGFYRVGKMALYVSGGTGSWGPLIRLGTTPELTVLRLSRSTR
ncbi:MAG: metallophosphoesterase [Bdellovibrionota bacterium]